MRWLLNNECWLLNNERWLLKNECWLLNNERWLLNNERWLLNNIPILVYAIGQIVVFLSYWLYYWNSQHFKCSCKRLSVTFPLGKASAGLISVNTCILLFGCIGSFRKYTLVNKYIPFNFKQIHYLTVGSIYIWSVVHTIAHYINFSKLRNAPYTNWGIGFTGHMLVAILIVLGILSLPIIRKQLFHKFFASHIILVTGYIVFMYLHQSFCFIKTDRGTCPLPTWWIWVTIPLILYTLETVWKFTRKPIIQYNVITHTQQLIELQLPLPKTFAGKWIRLYCSRASLIEWHPFAVTNYNDDTVMCSIHIKSRGDWTRRLIKLLSEPIIQPPVFRIDGPFLHLPYHFATNIVNNRCLVFASGIGLTTFAYDIFNSPSSNTKLVIICKDITDIQWFNSSNSGNKFSKLNVHCFFTNPGTTPLVERAINENDRQILTTYSMGRPTDTDIQELIRDWKPEYIYHSGVKTFGNRIKEVWKNESSDISGKFYHVD